ncbi:MAG: hypothetical protein ACLRTQ_06385 [Candidatus Borkfalkia sp.]
MQKWMRRNALQALSVFYFIGENDTFQDFSARNSDAEMKNTGGRGKSTEVENKSLIHKIFLPKYRAILYAARFTAANSAKIFFEAIAAEKRGARQKLNEAIATEGLLPFDGENYPDFPALKDRALFEDYHDDDMAQPSFAKDEVLLTIKKSAGDIELRFCGVAEFHADLRPADVVQFLDRELYRRADGLYEYDLECTSGETRIVFQSAAARCVRPVPTVPYILGNVEKHRKVFAELTREDRDVLVSSGSDPEFPDLYSLCGNFLHEKNVIFSLSDEDSLLLSVVRLSEKLNEPEEFSDGPCGYEGFFRLPLPHTETETLLKIRARMARPRILCCAQKKDERTIANLSSLWRIKNIFALPEAVQKNFAESLNSPFEEYKNALDPDRSQSVFVRVIYDYCTDRK